MKYFTLVISILLSGTPAAWAVPPSMNGPLYGNYESCPDNYGNYWTYDCENGLQICEQGGYEFIEKLFYDDNGSPVRYWNQNTLSGHLYELGNPNNYVAFEGHAYSKQYDILEDVTTLSGQYAAINVPGYGEILHDAGRIVVEGLGTFPTSPIILIAGEHQFFEENYEPVCDYLAGY